MKRALSILLLLPALCVAASAQFGAEDGMSARSISGQFIARTSVSTPVQMAIQPQVDGKEFLKLEPSRLVVSCERIKQAVRNAIGVSGDWSGTISITLRPIRSADDPIVVSCNRFNDGWNYQVDMPQTVRKQRFMRAIVQTVLLEMANRNAGKRSAEIPQWLTEGLTQQLLAMSESELMPPSPSKSVNGVMITRTVIDRRPTDPFENTRQLLQAQPQLTLEQLSWPTDAQITGEDGGVFQASAQLFTSDLLRLNDGPQGMRTMISQLADCYNWQTAFLRAFKGHFSRLLDVEKWWALQMVNFTGRDPARFWTLDESWRKLDEILQIPAQVRHTASDLPLRTELKLQDVINEWDFSHQKKALDDRMRTLGYLRLRLAPDVAALAVEYQETLAGYLKQRRATVFTLPISKTAPTVGSVARNTVKQLDALDEKRIALKSSPKLAGVAGE